MGQKKKKEDAFLRAYGIYTGMGAQFVVLVLLGVWLGKTLDEKLDTLPLFLIIGVVLGTATGFFVLYRTLISEQNHDKQQSSQPDSRN